MSRWKAAAIHASIILGAAVAVSALVLGMWFPPPYFHAAGADRLLLLFVGVNLSVGPLLTLVVFRSGKPGLRFDLAVIAVLQTLTLVYGFTVILQSRPIFLVGAVDRFVLVSSNEVTDADLAAGDEQPFRERSWTGAVLVIAKLPDDPKKRSDLIDLALSGRDIQNLPEYYHQYVSEAPSLLAKAKPVTELRQKSETDRELVDTWLRDSGRQEPSVVWLPLQARRADIVMLLDAQSAAPLKALAIDPW